MNVPSATGAPSQTNNNSSSISSTGSVDYDTFLKLLVAQLKNQDPTQPMDPTQYVAQLATFSNVEQSMKTNSKLDALMSTMALAQADGLIGRTITSADGEITGVVKSLQVGSTGGGIAVLEDGRKVDLSAGVTVS